VPETNPYHSPPERGPLITLRSLAAGLAIVLATLLAVAAFRLWEAVQDGWETTILRGKIACGVLGTLFVIALWAARRKD